METQLFCVLSLSLLLLLSFIPGFSANVCTQAAQPCVLRLVLYLLIFFHLIRAELTISCTVSPRVLLR